MTAEAGPSAGSDHLDSSCRLPERIGPESPLGTGSRRSCEPSPGSRKRGISRSGSVNDAAEPSTVASLPPSIASWIRNQDPHLPRFGQNWHLFIVHKVAHQELI